MKNHLKITADLEDDGTVGLTATVSFEEFSGSGEAWFNITEVKQFISELEHFAQTSEAPPELTGGIWDGEGNLLHKLLSLRFYSLSRFRAGVLVILASHPYTGCRPEEVASVQLELKPETQAIMHFCEQLNSLLSNKTCEARLIC